MPAVPESCPPRFDIAIVNYNTDLYLLNLLESIARELPSDALGTVHVWDNGSSDASGSLLTRLELEWPRLRAHHSAVNRHHGPALDALIRHACTTEWVLLLDSDTEVRCNFVPALPWHRMANAAFVGQINPHARGLYAYLAYLLIHRTTYLTLPPFVRDGAPGRDFFRAIEMTRRPFVRFRWSDFVRHMGQASLRRLVARGDTTNELYRFAATEVARSPGTAERAALEDRLHARVRAVLARDPAGFGAAGGRGPSVPAPVAPDPPLEPSHRRRRRSVTPGSVLAIARAPRHSLWIARARRTGLVQRVGEIRRLLHLVCRLRPRRLLEIGTAHGGTFYLWTRAAAPDATLISVDLPPWELDDPFEPEKVEQLRRFGRRRQSLQFVRADSHELETRRQVREGLEEHALDYLFIDGDHSYDGVAQDFDQYHRLVRPGGLVALHDIHPHSKGWGGDVPRFWRELRTAYPSEEIVADPDQDGFGIGVLRM